MEITIENLTYGGRGIGTVENKKVFVRGGLPGDVLEIQIIKDKKTFSEAIIKNIIKPSQHRVTPECKYFDQCGGCHWQNLDYREQLNQKQKILFDSLSRIGGFDEIDVEAIQESPKKFGYRNRTTLTSWFYNGVNHIGYFMEYSKSRVSIDECLVSSDQINEHIKKISSSLNTINIKNLPLDKVVIANGDEDSGATMYPYENLEPSSLNNLIKHFNRFDDDNYTSIHSEDNHFMFKVLDYEFISLPSAFIQANNEINELIVSDIIGFIEPLNIHNMIDLYCGIGNISIPCSEHVDKIVGVDLNFKSINLANRNKKLNRVENATFLKSSSEEFLSNLIVEDNDIDLVVIDPPREGAKTILQDLVNINAKHLAYLSCNPTTLARDLRFLVDSGYELNKIKPYDMFPHTYHLETLVFLTKS